MWGCGICGVLAVSQGPPPALLPALWEQGPRPELRRRPAAGRKGRLPEEVDPRQRSRRSLVDTSSRCLKRRSCWQVTTGFPSQMDTGGCLSPKPHANIEVEAKFRGSGTLGAPFTQQDVGWHVQGTAQQWDRRKPQPWSGLQNSFFFFF